MQHTQVSLDAQRYQQRLRDATQYSLHLLQDFPVDLLEPVIAYNPFCKGISVRQEVSKPEQITLDKYRSRLQEFNHDEYGSSPWKKQKLIVAKLDHVYEQNKKNQSILKRIQKKLSGCNGCCCVDGLCSLDRTMETQLIAKQMEIAQHGKQIEANSSKMKERKKNLVHLSDNEKNSIAPESSTNRNKNTEVSVTAMSRANEIAEVEEKLRAHHLSRTFEADRLFYNRLAERETSIILEEVLLDEIYDLATDVFDEEEEKNRHKELVPELLEIVEDALHGGPMEEVLVQKYNVNITRRHLQCLLPLVWLNDEVINFYFQMMSDRDEALVKAGFLQKRSHFFNSFFYTKVSENSYNFVNVRRWTKKIDLFAMDKIFVPVNVGNMHWCLAAIFMTEKRIQYYDSMHGSGASCIKVLMRYLHDESEHKKKTKFDDQGWKIVLTTPNTPLQTNGSDCGVFSCMFADYLSQNLPLSFKQEDIPYHRHRMVLHITRGYIPLQEEGL